jgi:hypothetical protein
VKERRQVVWTRRNVSTTECPKSYVTATSQALLDAYYLWSRLGGGGVWSLEPRMADAFVILQEAVNGEIIESKIT